MRRYFVFLCLLSLMGCALIPTRIASKDRNIYLTHDTTVLLAATPKNKVTILYTGCGGMVINSDSFSILIDPFYSNTGLFSLPFKKLTTNRALADMVVRLINHKGGGMQTINSVLISHSHYDHMLDLPYMLNVHFKNKYLKIVGNTSARNALAAMPLGNYSFKVPQFEANRRFDTFHVNEQMNITAIEAEHAPHFKMLGIKIKLMGGEIGAKGVKGFDTTDYKASAFKWKEGQDYAFLIEINKPGLEKPFRIFIQSSSCEPPACASHFPPIKDSIDIALIGVASTNFVKDYPGTLLKILKPRYKVLIHWEDFFRPYNKEPSIVRATKFKTFLQRYIKAEGVSYASTTSMSRPLTSLTFLY